MDSVVAYIASHWLWAGGLISCEYDLHLKFFTKTIDDFGYR